ncbi:hypothetical protein B0H16DRAFT_1456610 [Mycena metata]|uniref:Uncharacterized protein n=1 Tax=Mycena metata TaxID=1033252 RepID=A0AAD7NFE9_9AGAR|nr:hypothetical protein B0H16DRAFT_1456610 [Mycena metata]
MSMPINAGTAALSRTQLRYCRSIGGSANLGILAEEHFGSGYPVDMTTKASKNTSQVWHIDVQAAGEINFNTETQEKLECFFLTAVSEKLAKDCLFGRDLLSWTEPKPRNMRTFSHWSQVTEAICEYPKQVTKIPGNPKKFNFSRARRVLAIEKRVKRVFEYTSVSIGGRGGGGPSDDDDELLE